MPREPKVGVGTSMILYRTDYSKPDWPNQILLGMRSSPLETGKWGMPGGWLDFGEQPIDGCIREVFEETGLDLTVGAGVKEFGMFAHPLPSIDVWCATLYFSTYWNAQRIEEPRVMEPDKMSEWRWFGKEELLRLTKAGALMGSIPKALARFYKDLDFIL